MSDVKKIATRQAYGEALAELGEEFPNLVVMDADLAASTKTAMFGKKFPERFFDAGIAEANMVSMAAGLATTGKTVFASSFAMFATGRAYEQIRNSVGYPKLNVKIAATHGGISVGEDGATHQCIEDVALMRNIPGMVVCVPSDYVEAKAAVRAAIEHEGPVFLRFGRSNVPVINDREDYKFELGKGIVLKEGTDVTIIGTGICVDSVIQAEKMLAEDGINAQIVNIHTIKPIDEELIETCALKTKKIVTVEEHSVIGGLGSAVCDVVCRRCPVPVMKIGVQDVFGTSGSCDVLMHYYRLDAQGVYEQVKEFLGK